MGLVFINLSEENTRSSSEEYRVKRVVLPRWLCIDSDSDSPTILGYRMGSETLTMAASKKRVQKS